MDTYWYCDSCKCVKCGRCVTACKTDGEGFLSGGRDRHPYGVSDYVPCHHCTGFSSDMTPCQSVCHYGAISTERW